MLVTTRTHNTSYDRASASLDTVKPANSPSPNADSKGSSTDVATGVAKTFPPIETLAMGGISEVAREPLSRTGGGTLITGGAGVDDAPSSSPPRFANMACNVDRGGPTKKIQSEKNKQKNKILNKTKN